MDWQSKLGGDLIIVIQPGTSFSATYGKDEPNS
jgi:hypothetical protein